MAKDNDFMDDVVEIGVSLLVGYAISRVVRIALARGESMLPTIKNNQLVLVDCRAYRRREPRRHDLVAFHSHLENNHKFFLKRVIGVPGDHVVIKDHQLFINDELIEEWYLNEKMIQYTPIDVVVAQGDLFVMGDNRQHSLDSRSKSLGLVAISDIMGVVKRLK
ncbi:MAG: signal peptidase I [Turicibacter sp.]